MSVSRGAPTSGSSADGMDDALSLFRTTRMGRYFSSPEDPPAFLKEMFVDEDELKAVSYVT
jgi:hypothetical protein